MKKYFVVSINAKPLFDIERSFIDFFYEMLIEISEKGILILCTDLDYDNAFKLVNEVKLKKGYIIMGCGSSIYNIEENKVIYKSHIKKTNVYPILRQVLVNSDTIVLYSPKVALLNTNDFNLTKLISKYYEKIQLEKTYDYENSQKFIKKNNIEYIEIFNNNIGLLEYEKNEESVKKLVDNEHLVFNRLSKSKILINDSSFQKAIDFLLKKDNGNHEICHICLTRIFSNQKINSNFEFFAKHTLDDLFLNRTFFLFKKSLMDILLDNKLHLRNIKDI